jgi:hypothetical protein
MVEITVTAVKELDLHKLAKFFCSFKDSRRLLESIISLGDLMSKPRTYSV